MSKPLGLIFLVFYLSFYSGFALSGFDTVTAKFYTPGGRAYFVSGLDRSLLASQYKIGNGLPTNSTFHAPVPYSATATVQRKVPLAKNLLGKVGRLRAFSPQGLAFQAALLAGGYLLDYLIPGDPTSPAIDAHSEENISDPTQGRCESAYIWNSGTGWINASKTYSSCNSLIVKYGPLNYRWVEAPPMIVDVPITDPQIADTVFPPLTDQEFDDFINAPDIRQPLIDSQPYQDMIADADSDFDAATDTIDGINPDLSTFPTVDPFFDDGLKSMTVPEYDDVPLSNTDITIDNTNPDLIVTTHTNVDSSAQDGTTTTTVTRTTTDSQTGTVIDVDVQVTTSQRPNQLAAPVPAPAPAPAPVPEHNLCEEHPDSVACTDFGDTLPPMIPIPTDDVPFDFQVFQLADNSSCPQPHTFTLLTDSKSYSISYDPICQFASLIKPLILALGVFVAFTIVTQSVKSGGAA